MSAELVGISVAVAPGRAAYIPLAHDYDGAPAQLETISVLDALVPLLNDTDKTVIGQHLKYDLNVLRVMAQPSTRPSMTPC